MCVRAGEDPVLGSVMVQPLIKGIQQNVMAVAKHYILNVRFWILVVLRQRHPFTPSLVLFLL